MKLLKKVEVALLVSVLSCTNLVMAEELPEVSEIVEVNESVQEVTTEEVQVEEPQETIIPVEDIEQPTEIVEEVQVEEVQVQDAYADSSEQKIKDFIQRIYKNCLGRESDANGLNYWVNQLSSKSKNASSVLEQFLCSEEFEKKGISDSDYIKILYTVCMDRTADQGGIDYWLGQLKNSNRKNILSGFVASDEFTKICNTYGIEKGSIEKDNVSNDPVVNFVQRFYEKCLGRAGDEGGINYWVNGLKNGTFTGQDIANNFMLSTEFKNKNLDNGSFIKVLYTVLMDRNAEQSGLNYWVQLLSNGTSKESAINGFIESDEFTNICNTYGIKKKKEDKLPSPASDFEFSDGVITKYVGKGGDVVIPQMINGQKVKGIKNFAFYGSNIKSLTILDAQIDVGSYAFGNCTQLENISIKDGRITIEDILNASIIDNAGSNFIFDGCTSLKYMKELYKDYAYEGEIKLINNDIVVQGIGKLEMLGASWEGIFENNQCIKGKITYTDDYIYEGEIKNFLANGRGIMTYVGKIPEITYNPNGDKINIIEIRKEGNFKDGKLNGYCKVTLSDNTKLEGNYIDEVETGIFKITRPNGTSYYSEWY